MKFMTSLIILILTIFCKLSAPEQRSLYIAKETGMNRYESLIKAIGYVESRHNNNAYNPAEEATGYFQITPVRLRDYNRKTGKNYQLADMKNYRIAKEVFLFYCKGRSYEVISRCWNGGDENGMKYRQTAQYWNLVKAKL